MTNTIPVELVGGPLCGGTVNWPQCRVVMDFGYMSVGGYWRISHDPVARAGISKYRRESGERSASYIGDR